MGTKTSQLTASLQLEFKLLLYVVEKCSVKVAVLG